MTNTPTNPIPSNYQLCGSRALTRISQESYFVGWESLGNNKRPHGEILFSSSSGIQDMWGGRQQIPKGETAVTLTGINDLCHGMLCVILGSYPEKRGATQLPFIFTATFHFHSLQPIFPRALVRGQWFWRGEYCTGLWEWPWDMREEMGRERN